MLVGFFGALNGFVRAFFCFCRTFFSFVCTSFGLCRAFFGFVCALLLTKSILVFFCTAFFPAFCTAFRTTFFPAPLLCDCDSKGDRGEYRMMTAAKDSLQP